MLRKIKFMFIIIVCATALSADDWPVFKGNIYYTGNNDEITVKNGNLKWLFEAANTAFNPVISDGRIYFLDIAKNVYCLDEETGRLRWKVDLRQVSSQFRSSTKVFGKSKYPLVKGDRLFITDNIAIYCIDKNSGQIIWARTGMRSDDANLKVDETKGLDRGDIVKSTGSYKGDKSTYAQVDGIYSDPVIVGDVIYYGTRNELVSREIVNGHMLWNNSDIKSWSQFPSFYDNLIFTSSMDYSTNIYSIYCLQSDTGSVVWVKKMNSPHRIFAPLVYRNRIYFASGNMVTAIDIKTGESLWSVDCGAFITSNPSFTERSLILTVGNGDVSMLDPETRKELKRMHFGDKASPYFVTIRDQIYVATGFEKNIGGRNIPWTKLEAFNMTDSSKMWDYSPQFPGGPSQISASNGIMFLPAGNYIYAVGTDYYPKIVEGGDGYYDPYNRINENETPTKDEIKELDKVNKEPDRDKDKEMPMRRIRVTVKDKDGNPIPATVEVKKWHKGKVIYNEKVKIKGKETEINVPDMDDVELTADSTGYLPDKAIISRQDEKIDIDLDKIEKGKGIVVDNIHFEVDKAYLKKESLNILDGIITEMKKNPSLKLEIRGHTDSSGGTEHNQKLSERRADAVVEYMIKQGISAGRLNAVGYGETKPVASNKTADGRRKNRRTEFFVIEN